VLHSISFVDDPTRILRAVRYEQRFHFKIEARTMELLRDAVPMLDRVSGARIATSWSAFSWRTTELTLRRLWTLVCFSGCILVYCRRVGCDKVRPTAPGALHLPANPIWLLNRWITSTGIVGVPASPDAHAALSERLGLRGQCSA